MSPSSPPRMYSRLRYSSLPGNCLFRTHESVAHIRGVDVRSSDGARGLGIAPLSRDAERAAATTRVQCGSALCAARRWICIMLGAMPSRRPGKVRCHKCKKLSPAYDIVYATPGKRGQYRPFCSACLNAQVAQQHGLSDFRELKFEPVTLADCAGDSHQFHFQIHLFGPGVALNAFEIRDGRALGYRFEVIGDPHGDLFMLLGRLIEKMRRALSIQHLEHGPFGLQITDDHVVRGRIESDEAEDGQIPVVVVDGKEIPWLDFGRMLMTYEGFQFKLTMHDVSEEI